MTARQNYDAMIRDEVGPWLRARGFRKRRNRFRRADRDGWQVVDFQASAWGGQDDVRFTINIWAGVTELAEADAERQVWSRVGKLMPGGEDHWWAVAADADITALGAEVRAVLVERCLPWLDARGSLDKLMALAREAPDAFPHHGLGRFRMLLSAAGFDDLASEVPA